jgi:transposase-like protein
VITVAVRWYLRYSLSYRDLEELLADRDIAVDHVTVYRWVQRFTPLFADAARPCRHAAGDRWFVDETYVKVAGRWRYLYRAVDQSGRSSTCCCPSSGTPPRPAASSYARWPTGARRSR